MTCASLFRRLRQTTGRGRRERIGGGQRPQQEVEGSAIATTPKGAARTRTGEAITPEIVTRNARRATSGGAEMGANLEIPADLQRVIDHWAALPPEVKQAILTLVKHSRKRKSEKIC